MSATSGAPCNVYWFTESVFIRREELRKAVVRKIEEEEETNRNKYNKRPPINVLKSALETLPEGLSSDADDLLCWVESIVESVSEH